jgi:hypothetical protein
METKEESKKKELGEPKKQFERSLKKQARVLFSISAPDYPLVEEAKQESKDEAFGECVKLILNTPGIEQVTLNLTFLLSRWNILADLIQLVSRVMDMIKLDERYKALNGDAFKRALEEEFKSIDWPELFYQTLRTLAFKVKDLITSLENCKKPKKEKEIYIREQVNQLANGEGIKELAENRGQQWEQQNAKVIKRLKDKLGSSNVHKFCWREYLAKKEKVSELREKLNIESSVKKDFQQTLGQAKSQRFQKKYRGIPHPAKLIILSCLHEYSLEEAGFCIWLRECSSIKVNVEIHDGSLNAVAFYAIKHSIQSFSNGSIPFIKIMDKKSLKQRNGAKHETMNLNNRIKCTDFFSRSTNPESNLKTRDDFDISHLKRWEIKQKNGKWSMFCEVIIDLRDPDLKTIELFLKDLKAWKDIQHIPFGEQIIWTSHNEENKVTCELMINEKSPKERMRTFDELKQRISDELTRFVEKTKKNLPILNRNTAYSI